MFNIKVKVPDLSNPSYKKGIKYIVSNSVQLINQNKSISFNNKLNLIKVVISLL